MYNCCILFHTYYFKNIYFFLPFHAIQIFNKYLYFIFVQVKRRCTTAACAGRCCPPSAPWTATCWFTRGSAPSPARCAPRPSPPTATCTATGEHTTTEPPSKATAPPVPLGSAQGSARLNLCPQSPRVQHRTR